MACGVAWRGVAWRGVAFNIILSRGISLSTLFPFNFEAFFINFTMHEFPIQHQTK